MRVKRGMKDTSKKGGMFKDQVYLKGAIEVLRNRHKIDFVGFYSGKICLDDYFKLDGNGTIIKTGLHLPYFL